MSNSLQIFDPPDHPAVAPSYSQISVVSLGGTTKLISLAGQVGHDSATNTIPSSFIDQVRLALSNVDALLVAAGASKKDIISSRQYVVRMSQLSTEDFKALTDIVVAWFDRGRNGLKPPPDTLIGVESLAQTGGNGEYLFEIEVVAVVNG